MDLTAVFVRDGEWWAAYIEEIPGANTQGRTMEEARENLREALEMILEARKDDSEQLAKDHEVVRERILPRAS